MKAPSVKPVRCAIYTRVSTVLIPAQVAHHNEMMSPAVTE